MSHKRAKRQRRRASDQRRRLRKVFAPDPLLRQIAECTTPEDLEAEDAAAADDARFFERHPEFAFRVRPPFGGEARAATPPGKHCVAVHVHAIGDGLRVRELIFEALPPRHHRH